MTLQIAEFNKGNQSIAVVYESGKGYRVEKRVRTIPMFYDAKTKGTYGNKDAALKAAFRQFKKL